MMPTIMLNNILYAINVTMNVNVCVALLLSAPWVSSNQTNVLVMVPGFSSSHVLFGHSFASFIKSGMPPNDSVLVYMTVVDSVKVGMPVIQAKVPLPFCNMKSISFYPNNNSIICVRNTAQYRLISWSTRLRLRKTKDTRMTSRMRSYTSNRHING